MSDDFAAALEKAREERVPVMALRHNERGLDDVVVETPTMFRAEMMDSGLLWMCCRFSNGEEVTFHVMAVKDGRTPRLDFSVTGTPPDWRDWDEMHP